MKTIKLFVVLLSSVVLLLRANPGFSGCKVIALTADRSDDQRRECLRAGFDEVCAKPVTRQRIERLLDRATPALAC